MKITSICAALVLATIVVACSSSSSSSGTDTKVKDQRGDTCAVPEHASFTISCDQTPTPSKACTAGATACWIYSTPFPPNPARICSACCSGSTAGSAAGDCSNITCTTNADCPASTTCSQGTCS
jgi:hypothetical protein